MLLSFPNRDTEYKGLQLSLDQVTSTKPSFTYNSPSNPVSENRRVGKSRVSRTKTKTRLSPYSQVSITVMPSI